MYYAIHENFRFPDPRHQAKNNLIRQVIQSESNAESPTPVPAPSPTTSSVQKQPQASIASTLRLGEIDRAPVNIQLIINYYF